MITPLPIPEPEPELPGAVLVTLPLESFLADFIPAWRVESREELVGAGRRVAGEMNENRGIDQLAFYRSFRHGPGWGIHIKRHGILGLAHHIVSTSSKSTPVQRSIKAAYKILYQHELFHFQVDCAFHKLETAGRSSIDVSRLRGKDSLYRQSRGPSDWYDPLEEALANARAIRDTKTEYKQSVASFMKKSPTGYRDFGQFSSKQAFFNGLDSLFNLTESGLDRAATYRGIGTLVDLDDDILNGRHVPVYLILD